MHDPKHDLDQDLLNAFAHAAAPADDLAFLARVQAAVERVERQRRWLRGLTVALIAAAMLAMTPWVVELSLRLAQAALSPEGALLALVVSLTAPWMVMRGAR